MLTAWGLFYVIVSQLNNYCNWYKCCLTLNTQIVNPFLYSHMALPN